MTGWKGKVNTLSRRLKNYLLLAVNHNHHKLYDRTPYNSRFFSEFSFLLKTLIHSDTYITDPSLHKRIRRMKEKACEKDEINSKSFTRFSCHSTVLTVTSPLTLLTVPFGIFVSPFQLHMPVSFFSLSLSSFSYISGFTEASKVAVVPSPFRMGVCTKEMEGDYWELGEASSFNRARGEGTRGKQDVSDIGSLLLFP